MESPIAIKVTGLGKTFQSQSETGRKIKALDGISLDIYEGEILGILGPNGAGKTTFLNILSTLLLPDRGAIEILGLKFIPKNFSRIRRLLNMSSGYPNYPWCMTVEENLRFYGRLYGLATPQLNRRVPELIDMFQLSEYARMRFDELSSGNKQRLSLAKALINDPRVLFLDEPTVGLDPDVAARTREIIRRILKDLRVTVLFTTHDMREAELLCQRIAFLKQGKMVKLATPEELKRSHGKKDLEEVFIELARQSKPEETLEVVQISPHPDGIVRASVVPESLIFATWQWVNRCLAFTYRNFLFAIRNVFAFVELVFWPLVTLISIGLMGDYLRLQSQAFAFILTGAITGGVLQVTQLDVAYSLLYEVWSKSMKHTMLTPVGASEHMFGSWAIGIVRGTIILALLGGAANVFFGFHFPGMAMSLIFLVGIFGFALLLGLMVSVLILTFGQKAEITAWMFAYLFMLLCGIYYPVQTLPPFFHALAQWIPLTYFLEYFRRGFGFVPSFEHGLTKGFLLTMAYLGLGILALKGAFHKARQKGIIIRLSE